MSLEEHLLQQNQENLDKKPLKFKDWVPQKDVEEEEYIRLLKKIDSLTHKKKLQHTKDYLKNLLNKENHQKPQEKNPELNPKNLKKKKL